MAGSIGKGARHLRGEWDRWWTADDQTDTHIAHRVLNDQYRIWQRIHQRTKSEVHQNIGLLKQQQKQATYMQMQRMQMQKQMRGRGYGGYGLMGMGGASPMISYRMMQWAQLQMKINQQEFEFTELTPGMLEIGRGQLRARRHRAAAATALGMAAVWGLIGWASPVAAALLLVVAAAVSSAAAWSAGRNPKPRRPPVPRLLFVPKTVPEHTEPAQEPEPEPFPIREAGRDPKRAQESVRLALAKHGAKITNVAVPEQTDWGWRVRLVSEGTLAELVRLLPKLAPTLRVGENRLTVQRTTPEDAADLTMRILTSDPFAEPLPYPQRSPGSCTITQPVSLGLSLEGETTPVVLAGQHVIITANTGGGKSALTQCLAEYATACRDAVVVDIDPFKRGLRSLSQAAVRSARTAQEAEPLLEELVERARARIASLPPTQPMWRPTPDAPAIVVFLDEFPKLSKRGRELGIDLLRLGREAMVTVVICTQDASEDAMGDAIADVPGVRILMPCRAADVPLVIGQSDAVSRGWLPHLLVPSPDEKDPADAGRFYCITPQHREPILRYVSPLPAQEADRRARERVAAGLPRLDPAVPAAQVPDGTPEIARMLLEIFATEGDPEVLSVAVIADHLVRRDPAVWGRWEDKDDRTRRRLIGSALRQHLKKAGVPVEPERITTEDGRLMVYRRADLIKAASA
ncbi:hypothetical protein [Streptomyces axinellae]|uniref:AAA+ ATPase domain-containing protein n=1 Tax=Streptomyces axinellae TaxID=552788 RepID=A0ABP6DH93_9ACTN